MAALRLQRAHHMLLDQICSYTGDSIEWPGVDTVARHAALDLIEAGLIRSRPRNQLQLTDLGERYRPLFRGGTMTVNLWWLDATDAKPTWTDDVAGYDGPPVLVLADTGTIIRGSVDQVRAMLLAAIAALPLTDAQKLVTSDMDEAMTLLSVAEFAGPAGREDEWRLRAAALGVRQPGPVPMDAGQRQSVRAWAELLVAALDDTDEVEEQPEEWHAKPSVVLTLLQLVGAEYPRDDVDADVITGWDQDTLDAVARWAGAVHLRASDNDVDAQPMPDVLR